MRPGQIRPLALAVFRRGNEILVSEGRDPATGKRFFRPMGGGIEFGEYGRDAVAREIREELGAEIADVRFLGVIENIFTYAGSKGHEIMLFYSARLVEERFYMQESVLGHDDDGEFVARWVSLDAARRATAEPVYPEGLVDLIEAGDRGPAVEGRSTR